MDEEELDFIPAWGNQEASKETTGKEYRLLEDGEELIITCESCKDELLYIKTVLSDESVKRWKVKCGCGEDSFWIKYFGQCFISPAIGKYIHNIETVKNQSLNSLDTILEIKNE